MVALIYLIIVAIAAAFALRAIITASPARLAGFVRKAGPALLGLVGLFLTFTGRIAIGAPLLMMSVVAFRRLGQGDAGFRPTTGRGRISRVRTAAIEMILDQDSGEMTGTVLAGRFEGHAIELLDEQELSILLDEVASDGESVQLLEAYLDTRFPGWRERADPQRAAGPGGASTSRTMSKQEAHEVLGLGDSATASEIREAHRRLMKRMHPDAGGSDFLAARINEAKEVLLGNDGH